MSERLQADYRHDPEYIAPPNSPDYPIHGDFPGAHRRARRVFRGALELMAAYEQEAQETRGRFPFFADNAERLQYLNAAIDARRDAERY